MKETQPLEHYSDWLPTEGEGQFSRAKDWKTVMTPKQGAWNIPAAALTELDAFIHAAETALAAAKNETTRTPVTTAECKAAFDALAEKMRDVKRRYFLTPRLIDPMDYVSLGLKPHDSPPQGERNPHVILRPTLSDGTNSA
jgi:hypothetical protein